MRIKVFGTPSVWKSDEPVGGALAQKRRMALVSLLAVGAPPGSSGVSRERLLALLWPGYDDERGRAALSQALYAIRRDLAADDAITGQGELRLNPQRVSCDYWDFLQAIEEGADSQAAELRAGPLLDGLEIPEARELEFWVEERRREAEVQWAGAADRLAAASLQGGDSATAVRWRRALANSDPLSGRAALNLAKALEASGEREAALRQLKVHAVLVEQELETPPSAEVRNYIEVLQRPAPAPSTAPPTPSLTAPAAASPVSPLGTSNADLAPTPEPAPVVVNVSQAAQTSTPTPPPPVLSRRLVGGSIAMLLLAIIALVAFIARRPNTVTQSPSTDQSITAPGIVFAIGQFTGDSLGAAAAGMLATNLARAGDVEVIATARVAELLVNPDSGLAAIRSAGATDFLDGTLLRDGSGYRLEVRRTDLTTGRIAGSTRVEGADLFAAVDRASADILQRVSTSVLEGSIADVSSRSLPAWQLYQEAQRAHFEGRRDAALAAAQGALRTDSTFAMAALLLSQIVGPASAEHLPLLRQAVRMSGRATPAEAAWIRVNWLGAMDDPGFGAAVDSMAARYPRNLDVQMMVAGPALFGRADFATALRALEGVWRSDSARIAIAGRTRCFACEATEHLNTVLLHADSMAAAERSARRYIAMRPSDGLGWNRLAAILERDPMRHAELEAVVDSAVAHGEAGAVVHRLLAATRRGDTVAFNRAVADPRANISGSAAHWSRAILYRNIGRLDEALVHARAYAATLRAGAAEEARVRRTLEATILLDQGRAREAAEIWAGIAKLPRPEWSPSRLARQRTFYFTLAATARYEAGDTTGLAALADSLAVIGASSGYVRDRRLHAHVRGLVYLARGRTDAAAAELRQAIAYPSMGFTRTNWYLAQALERLGRREEARHWLAAAARGTRDGSPLYQNPLAAWRRATALPRR